MMHRSALTLSLALALGTCPALAQERAPVSPEDVAAVARGDAAFATDLYQAIRDTPGNLFVSPYSVSQALGLAYVGAKGETAAELERVLHVELPAERWHAARHRMAQGLAAAQKPRHDHEENPFRLSVADRAWGQQGYRFLPSYLQNLEAWYGAGLEPVDFQGDLEGTRKTINAWVSDQTEERIPELLQPADLKRSMRLVLTNAVYFKAAWRNQFEPDATREGAFHRVDGSDVQVPLMQQVETFWTGKGDGYQWVEMFYEGRGTSMIVLVPDAGTFEQFEASFDASALTKVLQADGTWARLDLRLPRFEARSRVLILEALKSLGLDEACRSGAADFSGMDGTRELFVGGVIHEAFVKVDEEGTEAAAATAVMMDAGGMPAEPQLFSVDRPFLYLIRERETGAVVFMGRVLDPSTAQE
jgi:serpin B